MKKIFPFAGLIVFHLVLASQLQFTAWPEMLAYPYLLQKGFLFYQDIVHPYLPLLPYLAWGVSSLFGLTVATIQGITYVFIIVSDLLLILIMNRWFNRRTKLLLLITYIGLQLVFDGNGLWFDLAVTPFILTALYTFWKYITDKDKWIFVSGLSLGIGFLIKQTVLAFIIFEVIYLLIKRRYRHTIYFVLVIAIPFTVQFLFFDPRDLIEWGILFPLFAVSRLPGYILFPTVKQLLVTGLVISPLLWLSKIRDKRIWLIASWSVVALIFTVPRFDYFHLQPLLPLTVLTLGIVFTKSQKSTLFTAYLIIYLIGISGFSVRYFWKKNQQLPRFFSVTEGQTANLLQQRLPTNEPIYFYNTTANYFIMANLTPTKPWVDLFPWYLELPGMQNRVINNLEEQRVNWVVATEFTQGGKFDLGSYRPQEIDAYIRQNYYDFDEVSPTVKVLRRNN